MARIRFLHAVDLIVDPWHSAQAGKGVLRIVGTGRIIDAAALRENPDARIITDDSAAVCKVLGIVFPDPQVIQEGEAPEGVTGCDDTP